MHEVSPAARWGRSHWLEQALAREGEGAEAAPALDRSITADVCIVGGGFTGLWTALMLKEREPGLDVALLEADVCGAGASGRNGGFAMTWWSKFATLEKRFGTEEARHLAAASADAITAIGAFCERHGVDAEFREDGWLWTATNEAQVGAWRETLDALAKAGHSPFVELSTEEVQARAGSRAHLAGVFEPKCASVQPGALVRGLRRVALEQGVRIFERSPMVELERSRPPAVATPRGRVTADVVVLALNAWAARLKELRRQLVVVSSDVVATERVPDRLAELGWTDGVCISDSRLLADYYRTTVDGRVVFGKSMARLAFDNRIDNARYNGPSPQDSQVAGVLRWMYPTLADVPIARSWTGPVDRPIQGVASFSRLGGRRDILYGAGYSGSGVAQSHVGARMLTSLVLGVDDEWSGSGMTQGFEGTYPFEPIRFVGGSLVRKAVYRKEAAQDAGRKVDFVTERIARFAPAGLVPVDSKDAEPSST
jgi:putative aminophosphonate oxidoreductase